MNIIGHYQYYTKDKWAKINPFNKSAIKDFIIECKSRKLKETTIEQYESDLRVFLCYIYEQCNNKKIINIQKKEIRNMIIWLSEKLGLSNARVNRILSCCRSFFNYLEEDEDYECNYNVFSRIKNLPQETVREIVFLENKTIMLLYDYFMDTEQYKYATLLALAYESAGRKNELAQVNKQSILNNTYNTNIVTGKKGKKFPLIFFDLTQEAGEKYLEQRENDNIDNLFITKTGNKASSSILYDWVVSWREILYELTGEYYMFNVHSFRHSCLQNLINGSHEVCKKRNLQSIGFEELRRIAHHENINITTSYLKKNNDIEYLNNFFKTQETIERKQKEKDIESDDFIF